MYILNVTNYGQIKEGDILLLETNLGKFKVHAKIICNENTPDEEIVIHKTKNHYFILHMMLNGSSWVKSAKIVSGSFDEYKAYSKYNVKNL